MVLTPTILLHPEHTHTRAYTEASSHGEGEPAYIITSVPKSRTRWVQVIPGRVTPELLDLEHVRVLPEAELVLAEAVGRHELLVVLRPLEGAHLYSRQDNTTRHNTTQHNTIRGMHACMHACRRRIRVIGV